MRDNNTITEPGVITIATREGVYPEGYREPDDLPQWDWDEDIVRDTISIAGRLRLAARGTRPKEWLNVNELTFRLKKSGSPYTERGMVIVAAMLAGLRVLRERNETRIEVTRGFLAVHELDANFRPLWAEERKARRGTPA